MGAQVNASDWLTSPALTAQLSEFKADRERLWRIVDKTFEDMTVCESCPFLNVREGRNGNSYACDLRARGDVLDCAGVEAAMQEESCD